MYNPTALQQMAERHAGVLTELTDLLMAAARACGEDVASAENPEAKAEAYKRLPALGRAVRQCLALEARLTHEAVRALQAAERDARAQAQDTAEAREARRQAERSARKSPVWNRVLRTLEDTFPDDGEDNADFYEREEDLRTRLDDETFEAEFAHLPYEDVIRILHRDLGLPEPQFGPQDRVRALIWAAQWGRTADPAADPAAPDPAPDPDPPPEPYFRYSSG